MKPTNLLFLFSVQTVTLTLVIAEVFECTIYPSQLASDVVQQDKDSRIQSELMRQQSSAGSTPQPPTNNICIFSNIHVDENMVVDFQVATSHHYAIAIKTVLFENSTVAMHIDELLDRLCGKFWNLFNVIVNGTHFNCHLTKDDAYNSRDKDVSSQPAGPLLASTFPGAETASSSSSSSETLQHKLKIIHFDVGEEDPVHQKLDIVLWGIAVILFLIVTLAVGGVVVLIAYRRQQRDTEFLWRSFRYGFR